ncbi:MAG: CorA family divalent cation transporter [Oceanicaulis sp.]
MLRIIEAGGELTQHERSPDMVWLDLLNPSAKEEARAESVTGRDVPTPGERAALESSARNYIDDGALFLTPTLLGRRDEGDFVSGPVTFMLWRGVLLTIREIDPRAFEIGESRASVRLTKARTAANVLVALLESVLERTADLISEQEGVADEVSRGLYVDGRGPDLNASLKLIGRIGSIAALCHSSLSSLKRSLIFLLGVEHSDRPSQTRLKIFAQDVEELERQVEALQSRMAFLQASTLGLVNSRQTNVLKALSLATISFVPATLIASFFGMNFESIHWYEKAWGPVAAIALMVAAPMVLFAVARWRNWF